MKIHYTETFYSLQGEGVWTGIPSVFFRTFGCNFKCKSFGRSSKVIQDKNPEVEKIIENIDQYKTFDDLPLVKTGCDSYSSVYSEFKKFAIKNDTDAIVERLLQLIPNNQWTQPNGQDIHLVITGGEPLLGWQRSYIDLLEHEGMRDLKNLTFETNATQKLHKDFSDYLQQRNNLHITWSCSPKLTVSGENWEEAIQPYVVKSYYDLSINGGSNLYLKFVVANTDDLVDVNRAVEAYRQADVLCPVYLMPVGGTVETYEMNNRQVAEYAMSQGWRYSPRLQCDLFGNAWGT